jgi:IMP dehydrogenase
MPKSKYMVEADSTPTVTVEMMMTTDVKAITQDMSVRDAIILLIKNRISGAPVVDANHQVISVVSEVDLLKIVTQGLDQPIGHCMSLLVKQPQLITLRRHDTFAEAYKIFSTKTIHRIIVVDDNGRLQGILTRGNVLRILVDLKRKSKVA